MQPTWASRWPSVRTDATAAMGMARRLGICKIRHLDTSLLWVQQAVRSGEVVMEKVPGVENTGDALTKYLPGPELRKHVERMCIFFEEGRAKSAPRLSTAIIESAQSDRDALRAERKRILCSPPATQEEAQCHSEAQFPLAPCTRGKPPSAGRGGVSSEYSCTVGVERAFPAGGHPGLRSKEVCRSHREMALSGSSVGGASACRRV